MLVDVQMSQHNSTAHMQRFFLPRVQKQMTVTSFDDPNDVLLMYIRGRYKRKCAQDPGVQSFILSAFSFGSLGLFPS